MTERRYDAAYAPTPAEMASLHAAALSQGHDPQIEGYLGGPRALNAWTAQQFADARAAGFDVGGIYVGYQAADFAGMAVTVAGADGAMHGRDAVTLAQRVGLPAGSRIALDIEAGAGGAVAVSYAAAFAGAVRAAGFRAELYGLVAFVNAAGAAFDATWAADYINTDPGTPTAPGVNVTPGHRAWQWRNSHTEYGANVDTSDADDDPQETPRMLSDIDIARGLVYAVRAALLGEDAGSNNGQEAAAVEAYAARIPAPGNVEAGLSVLIADCKNDGRYLPGRVAALEEWAKAQQAEVEPAPAPTVDLAPLDARVAALEAFRTNVKGA